MAAAPHVTTTTNAINHATNTQINRRESGPDNPFRPGGDLE